MKKKFIIFITLAFIAFGTTIYFYNYSNNIDLFNIIQNYNDRGTKDNNKESDDFSAKRN